MKDYYEKVKPEYHGYQELHVHTTGSFRDGANTVQDVFDAAEKFGRQAVAITDHGNFSRLFEGLKERTKREKEILKKELISLNISEEEISEVLDSFSAFDSVRKPSEKMMPYVAKYEDAFVRCAKKALQFVPGIEMYVGDGPDDAYHLVLYPKDWQGMKILFLLCNLAQLNKHSDLPRCTLDTLRQLIGKGSAGHDHVIATSACISGQIPRILLRPFELSQQKKKLEEKKAGLSSVDPQRIEDKKLEIESLQLDIKNMKADLSRMKKVVKKKNKQARDKRQIAYDKALEKLTGAQKDSAKEKAKADVQKKKERLDNAQAELRRSDAFMQKIPILEKTLSDHALLLAREKEELEALLKMYAPVRKVDEKILEVCTELENVGDVYMQAKEICLQYNDIFGRGNFYLELQNHGMEEETLVRPALIRMSEETGIPLTVSNDVHFKDKASKRKRDIIAALRFQGQTVEDIEKSAASAELYFKSDEEMKELFADAPRQALENPSRIAEQIQVYYKKEMHPPVFKAQYNGKPVSTEAYLRNAAYSQVRFKYPQLEKMDVDDPKRIAFFERLDYELDTIEKMGYSGYISIVEDFISFAKKSFGDLSIGPGRGSGAGSLVCYLVGITNVDPLRYNLIFERFLNPNRVSMPDIDTDLAPSIRDKVIDYVAHRYAYNGSYPVNELKSTVCAIATEGVLAARSAVRQAGKVTGVEWIVCDQIAKMIPEQVGISIKKALEDNSELQNLYNTDTQIHTLLDDAMLVEGVPVQTGVHAAGIIIADKPISEYAPMYFNEKKNTWVIQYDMIACEGDLGLLKIDFLGLRNLDIIMRCDKFIRLRQGRRVDFKKVMENPKEEVIREIYAKGDTNGIFQFESAGMKKTLTSFAPKSIDDIIMLNAAYRPGPMQFLPDITDVKFKRKKPKYIVPEMEHILSRTYGYPIYQEQIQQIFHEIAGFSLGQADIIRRAMSKKHLDELEEAKDGFVKGLKAKGASDEDIESFWAQLLDFAKYAFNKSHAAAYSLVSYITAYLKYFYPTEYMAALLSLSDRDSMAMYSKEVRKKGIEILPPDVNRSILYTAPLKQSRSIRIGLEAIKDVATNAQKVIDERKQRGPYSSLKDFLIRACLSGVDKTGIEALILSGALAELTANKKQAREYSATLMAKVRKTVDSLKKENADQDAIFERVNNISDSFESLTDEDYSQQEALELEKDLLGFYASGHPLEKYADKLRQYTQTQIADITSNGEEVTLAGKITQMRVVKRKKDGKSMCKFVLEDLSGDIRAVCFTGTYARYGASIKNDSLCYVKGKVEIETDEFENVVQQQLIVTFIRLI